MSWQSVQNNTGVDWLWSCVSVNFSRLRLRQKQIIYIGRLTHTDSLLRVSLPVNAAVSLDLHGSSGDDEDDLPPIAPACLRLSFRFTRASSWLLGVLSALLTMSRFSVGGVCLVFCSDKPRLLTCTYSIIFICLYLSPPSFFDTLGSFQCTETDFQLSFLGGALATSFFA